MTLERSHAWDLRMTDSDVAAVVAARTGYNIQAVRTILDAAGGLQSERIQQLLEANNAEVLRRRAETARADALQQRMERMECR